jgi:DNA-binding transcriptional regulator YiaG
MSRKRGKLMAWDGNKIRALRKRLKQTQLQFADTIGVSIDTLQNWEQDRFAPPPIAGKFFDRLQEDVEEGRVPQPVPA